MLKSCIVGNSNRLGNHSSSPSPYKANQALVDLSLTWSCHLCIQNRVFPVHCLLFNSSSHSEPLFFHFFFALIHTLLLVTSAFIFTSYTVDPFSS